MQFLFNFKYFLSRENLLMKTTVIFVILLLFLGCGKKIPTQVQRLHVVQNIAMKNSLRQETFKTSTFDIFTYKNFSTCKDVMSIYIEGDGLAWITSSRISSDPTPLNPISLKLMVKDDSTCKIYLARPCQYTNNSTCKEKYWTSHRFSKEVLQSYIEVLNKLKKEYKIDGFKLYGYSGGGAIATLLSAHRNDVKKLVTIAGNLDIAYWAKKHYITPLKGSLNPADFTEELTKVKQLHLIGKNDKIVDKSIYASYVRDFKDTSNIEHKLYKNFTHSCCWAKEWTNILKEIN